MTAAVAHSLLWPRNAQGRPRFNSASTLMECNRAKLSGVVASAGVCDAFGVLAYGRGQGVTSVTAEARACAGRDRKARCLPPKRARFAGDIDLRALGEAIARKRRWIILPTLLAAVAVRRRRQSHHAALQVRSAHPDRRARERVPAPEWRAQSKSARPLDAEAVTSQVQLVLSRDLAREVIKKNKLAELPEFDPVLQGLSPLRSLLALFGIGRDPFSMTPEERVLDAYSTASRLTRSTSRASSSSSSSRAIPISPHASPIRSPTAIWCCSRMRGRSRRKSASQWLSGEIDNLRKKVAEAEAQGRGFPLQVEPVRRHQQHHAVEPADGRGQHPAQQRARAEIRRGGQGAADPRDAPERQADRGLRSAQFRADPPPLRAAGDVAGAACRAVVDAARQPSAHQGAEGAARPISTSRSATRPAKLVALAGERRAHRRRPRREPEREPRAAQEAGHLDQRPGRAAARAGARGQGAARSARDPISPNTARPTRARPSTPRRQTAASFRAPSCRTPRPIRRSCRSS